MPRCGDKDTAEELTRSRSSGKIQGVLHNWISRGVETAAEVQPRFSGVLPDMEPQPKLREESVGCWHDWIATQQKN
jgi:hypothetical protein